MVVSGKSPGYFANDGGISRTLDGYADLATGSCSGTNQFDSLSQTLGSMTEFVSVSAHPTSADILLGGTQDNGSPKTSTATSSSTWQNALGGDGGFNAINPANPDEWFASNPYVTILKCEAGTACNHAGFIQVVGSNDLGGDQGAFYTPYILDPQNTSGLLVGTCRVWSISTSGTAPLQLSNDFDTLGTGVCTGDEINLVNAIAAGGPAPNGNSTVVYAVTNGYGPRSGYPGGEVWVTTNAGVSLMTNVTQYASQGTTQSVNPQGYAISTVAMDSSDATGNTAYVGIMGFSTPGFPTSHVWKTTNAGTSWTDWTGTGATGLPDNPANALLVDAQAGNVYAGTDIGVFVSSTATASWTEVGPAPGAGVSGFLPNAPVTALQLFNPNAQTKTLVASTYGRGTWSVALLPTFAITVAATPNATVVNQNVTWNGTLTALDRYSGSVTLSCTTGAPGTCGITPSTLMPAAAGSPFTVTLGSATTGTFTFTILGTDGTLTNASPAETLTVGTDVAWTDTGSASATVLAGQSATYTFSAAPVGDATFSSGVSLGCNNLPALTSCVFSPASIAAGAGTTAVTLTIATTGPNGGAQSRSRAAQRRVGSLRSPPRLPDSIALQLRAGALRAPVSSGLRQDAQGPGDRHQIDRHLRASTGRPRILPLLALGWVVLAGMVVLGRKRNGKSRLYIGIAAICLGLGLMTEISCGALTGSGGSEAGNFAIATTPTSGSTPVNVNVQWNGMLPASGGYSGTVALSCLPAGTPQTCAFAPQILAPTTAGTPFAVTLGSTTTGTFTFTISGTDGTLTNATPTETLTVTPAGPAPDFAIAVSPTPNSTAVNQNITWTGTLTALNGYDSGVTLSCTAGAPATCVFAHPTLTPGPAPGNSFTVTLGSATASTFTFMIQGTGSDGALTHTTPTETLTVTPPPPGGNFAIAVTPTQTSTLVNKYVTWNGTLTASNGYSGTVALSCTAGAPATCAFAPQVLTPTTSGTPFAVSLGSATAGTFTFTISGTDGTITNATLPETLNVGDFEIALTPTPNSTGVSPKTIMWNGTVTASGGYIGNVTLSCGPGAPEICEIQGAQPLTPLPAPGAAFAVMLGNPTAGLFNFTILGTDGTLTHATPTEALTVGTVAPTVTISPASATLFADESGNAWPVAVTQQQFTATVNGSTNQNVTWAVTGGSANGTVDAKGLYTPPALVPNPAMVTVTATSAAAASPGSTFVTVAMPTGLGASQITVTATAAGGPAHGDVVTLTVQ